MGSPMQEAASANLKKKQPKKGLLTDLEEMYKRIFPPVPPPAKQGTMTNRGERKQMAEIDKEKF